MESAANSLIKNDRRELCGKTLGDYTVIRRIGGGATSDVFLAKQNSLGRNVALKILKDDLSQDETYVRRFIHEARAAAKLEHPNVVRIYEVGELTDDSAVKRRWFLTKKGRSQSKIYRFIAQEYVAGLSLAQYLHRNGPLSIDQTFAAMEQVACALKRASDFKLIHRDVKPENIILDSSGVVHVVDFGLARPSEANDATWTDVSLTRTGVALGTPLYMSPEQARGQKVDSRSDVYSLGVTAYHMLIGDVPFRGESPLAVVLKHLNEKPRPIRELRPDAPEALARLVERMLAKNPDDRPSSPASLLQELRDAKIEYLRESQTRDMQEITAQGDANVLGDSTGFSLGTNICSQSSSNGNGSGQTEGDSRESDEGVFSSFFQTDEERKSFEHALSTTAVSMEWRANIEELESIRNVRERFWTPSRIALTSITTAFAFLVGGGLLILRNTRLSAAPPEPPLTIQRFNTVEEQYVFALQTGAVDAWKSVIEYFPNDKYWTRRAERQLALEYVVEDDVESADKLFKSLAADSSDVEFDPFPLAGVAWVSARRGDFAAATATISELSYYRTSDRLTEVLLSKTRDIIRNRNDSNGQYSEPRRAGEPRDASSNGNNRGGGNTQGNSTNARRNTGVRPPSDSRGGRDERTSPQFPGMGFPGAPLGERPNNGPRIGGQSQNNAFPIGPPPGTWGGGSVPPSTEIKPESENNAFPIGPSLGTWGGSNVPSSAETKSEPKN